MMSQPNPLDLIQPFQPTLPSNPEARTNIEHVLKHGYVVLNNVFSRERAREATEEIERLAGVKPKKGRNEFEGRETIRVYSLVNKTRALDDFILFPQVLSLNAYFLHPGYLLSAFHSIQINPHSPAQPLHHDDGYIHIPRPRTPQSAAILIALDDFTATNGATQIIPGSHLWDSAKAKHPDLNGAVSVSCPAGSVIYFLGTALHGGGKNVSRNPRRSLTAQWCQPWIRTIENYYLGVDPRKVERMPAELRTMLGYKIHPPFIGYVDGVSPVAGARRLVEMVQKPLEEGGSEEGQKSKL